MRCRGDGDHRQPRPKGCIRGRFQRGRGAEERGHRLRLRCAERNPGWRRTMQRRHRNPQRSRSNQSHRVECDRWLHEAGDRFRAGTVLPGSGRLRDKRPGFRREGGNADALSGRRRKGVPDEPGNRFRLRRLHPGPAFRRNRLDGFGRPGRWGLEREFDCKRGQANRAAPVLDRCAHVAGAGGLKPVQAARLAASDCTHFQRPGAPIDGARRIGDVHPGGHDALRARWLNGHRADKIRHSRRSRFRFRHLMDGSAQPAAVFPTVLGRAILAIPQESKSADLPFAIQALHASTLSTIEPIILENARKMTVYILINYLIIKGNNSFVNRWH